MPRIRYIFVLPIIAAYAAALVLLVLGFVQTFEAISSALAHGGDDALKHLKIEVIEVVDVFLLATILYVIASGFYQLFFSRALTVPPWLRVTSVHDLEMLLLGVVVMLLAVTSLSAILGWDGIAPLWPKGRGGGGDHRRHRLLRGALAALKWGSPRAPSA